MKKQICLPLFAVAFLCLTASRAAAQDTWDMSSVWYDDSTNTVWGYSSTELDYACSFEYSAYVNGQLRDQSGTPLDWNYDQEPQLAEVFTAASGDSSSAYLEIGDHAVIAYYYEQIIDKSPEGCYPCDGCNDDCYYYYENWWWHDPFGFSFMSNATYGPWAELYGYGPETVVEDSEYIPTGETVGATTVCTRPNGETTSKSTPESANWHDGGRYYFVATVLPTTTSFQYRWVTERNAPGGGPDTCWFGGSQFAKWENIDIHSGQVNNVNIYYDDVGFYGDVITYYRSHGRAPCGTTLQQHMAMYCDVSLLFYKYNTLEPSFTSTDVTSVRDSVSVTRSWP